MVSTLRVRSRMRAHVLRMISDMDLGPTLEGYHVRSSVGLEGLVKYKFAMGKKQFKHK
jgi:hypothetical protein